MEKIRKLNGLHESLVVILSILSKKYDDLNAARVFKRYRENYAFTGGSEFAKSLIDLIKKDERFLLNRNVEFALYDCLRSFFNITRKCDDIEVFDRLSELLFRIANWVDNHLNKFNERVFDYTEENRKEYPKYH